MKNVRNTVLRILMMSPIALMAVTPLSANMVLNLSFTANFNANFGSNAVAAQNAVIFAAQQFSSLYNDPIHVNLTVDAVLGTGTLGASNTFLNSFAYNTIRNAAINDAKSA